MATVREFVTRWGFDVDDAELRRLDDQVTRVQRNLQATAQVAVDIGTKLTLGITVPFGLLSGAALKAASDSEETLNKFSVVFQDVSNDAEMAAQSLAEGFGLAQDKAKGLLADTGDLLTGFGFTGESALKLSSQVQALAVDLASFTNFSGGAEGASQALTKALLGEREAIKTLGIAILEEDVKAKVQALTAAGRFTDETERERKAIATLEIALEQSKNAIGDFARSSQSFANQSRVLQARLRDLAVSFGQIILPLATKLVVVFQKVASFIGGLNTETKAFILIIGGLAAAVGPLLLIMGLLVQAVFQLKTGMAALGVISLKTFLLMVAKAILVAAAFALIFFAVDDLMTFFKGGDSVFGLMVKEIDALLQSALVAFPRISRVILNFLSPVVLVLNTIMGALRGLTALFGMLFAGNSFMDAFVEAESEFLKSFSGIGKIVSGEVGNLSVVDMLGFSGIRENVTGQSQSTNVNTNISVNVPAGTPPNEVAAAAERGVANALAPQLRQAGRLSRSAVVN